MDKADDVAIALCDLEAGQVVTLGGLQVTVKEVIPKGHKFARHKIEAGMAVTKYGHEIGEAAANIDVGCHVHSHNLVTRLSGVNDYAFDPEIRKQVPALSEAGFMGYRRANGRVGTRNDIWVIPTVGCVGNVSEQIARKARAMRPDHITDVIAITHPQGCSQLGDDLSATRNILAALACHPNVAGVLFVGLGCESNQLESLIEAASEIDLTRVRKVVSQNVGNEVTAGLQAISELFHVSRKDKASKCPISELVIGLKCGGSDAFSGLTANPMLGRLTTRLIASGGGAILTEIPEVFGAEGELMNRSENSDVFDKAVSVINDFKRYFIEHGQPVFENPSPGNKQGGITTLEEKSLGAVQKAGHAPLSEVIRYGQRKTKRGLTLLEAPGNDAVSCTALAAAGANVIVFTTGRGTPLGFPVPTIKVSTNTALSRRKSHWIDFNAGGLAEGEAPDAVDAAFLDCVCMIASGKSTANERNGEKSIALWKRGVTL